MKPTLISQLVHDFRKIDLHTNSYIYQRLIQDLYYFSIPAIIDSLLR